MNQVSTRPLGVMVIQGMLSLVVPGDETVFVVAPEGAMELRMPKPVWTDEVRDTNVPGVNC
jgi:hypothetical protein